jgi:hypothetical protein
VANLTELIDPTIDFGDPIIPELIVDAKVLNDKIGIEGENKGNLA